MVRKNGGYLGANDRFIDIRVYDAPDPIAELERLLALHKLHFFPSEPRTCSRSRRRSSRQLEPILLREPANQPEKWLTRPQGSANPTFLEALKNFMYWENYDVRVRMDGKIDRVVLDDILKKRKRERDSMMATRRRSPGPPGSSGPVRRYPLLRASAGTLDPVLHRDVGALQLLRHARAAHPVHDGAGRGRRAGLRYRQGRPDLRAVRSSVYLLSLPGGWVADRVLGLRPGRVRGRRDHHGGHICLAIPSLSTFYLGLVLIAVGTGLLKPNVSALVGKLYAPDDVRRDAGYSIYYMGINTRRVHRPCTHRLAGAERGFRGLLASPGFEPRAPGTGDSALRRWACSAAWCSTSGREAPVAGRAPAGPAERPGRGRTGRPPGSAGRAGTARRRAAWVAVAGGHRRCTGSMRRRSPATSSGCCLASRWRSSPGCS